MPTEIISSDHLLSDFEHPFKVFAGPGAGKTFWLINNIKNILKNSPKLISSTIISCITYTNVAVEEIKKRLGTAGESVEVSTIHSFLYKCVVKPYVHLIQKDGRPIVNVELLDGHDDHIPSIGKIRQEPQLNRAVLQNGITDEKELKDVLTSLDWSFSGDELVLQPRDQWRRTRYRKLTSAGVFTRYKLLFWSEGIIHHEDVLYFAHEILKKYSMISEFIASRYPYILVDEFQDTNPIQTKILRWLSEAGSIIGVIGDAAQSIFAFQGSARIDFIDFNLPGQQDYVMKYNRRSTRNIIKILNHIRGTDDVEQKCFRDVDGNEVCLIVNPDIQAVVDLYDNERSRLGLVGDSCIVTYQNSTVTRLKNCIGSCSLSIWEDFQEKDEKRCQFIKTILSALEYAHKSMIETALKEAMKILKIKDPIRKCTSEITGIFKTSTAVSLLEYLVDNRSIIMTKSLFEFYGDLVSFFGNNGITVIKIIGGLKAYAEATQVNDLLLTLQLSEEKNGKVRTIHKAKGTEFQSVLVYIDNNSDINHFLRPNVKAESDECRLYYVALSRAEDFLCIATDELSPNDISALDRLGIKHIGESAPHTPTKKISTNDRTLAL